MTDWYDRRDELRPDMVFADYEGCIVKLDRRVPGDGTKWYVADWNGRSWSYCDGTVEPGDLVEAVSDPAAFRARQMNAELPEATRDVLKLKGMI